jgi:hypothetical protein
MIRGSVQHFISYLSFQGFYLIYLPHLALPLAASETVIPLEQELKKIIALKIMRVKKDVFFITVRFFDLVRIADNAKNCSKV